MDTDVAINILVGGIKNEINRHVESLEGTSYQEILTSIAIALYSEVGRLRYLCEVTDEVDVNVFDTVFHEGTLKYYELSKSKNYKSN